MSAAVSFSPAAECGSKRPYRTKRAAKRAVAAVEAGFGTRLHAYRCHWCDFFHVGSRLRHDAGQLILCAGCGRPWRPRARYGDDGTLLWQRDRDLTLCAHCQPEQPNPEEAA